MTTERDYHAGDEIPVSGVYFVTHGPRQYAKDVEPHPLFCTQGERFPRCNHCENASFVLQTKVVAAWNHPLFWTMRQ